MWSSFAVLEFNCSLFILLYVSYLKRHWRHLLLWNVFSLFILIFLYFWKILWHQNFMKDLWSSLLSHIFWHLLQRRDLVEILSLSLSSRGFISYLKVRKFFVDPTQTHKNPPLCFGSSAASLALCWFFLQWHFENKTERSFDSFSDWSQLSTVCSAASRQVKDTWITAEWRKAPHRDTNQDCNIHPATIYFTVIIRLNYDQRISNHHIMLQSASSQLIVQHADDNVIRHTQTHTHKHRCTQTHTHHSSDSDRCGL